MTVGRFEICRRAADRFEVELTGELGERTLLACEAEVRTQLSAAKSGGIKVLIDLFGVEGYSLEARDVLVGLQRFLGGKASQTAFISDSAVGRSLALWVAHMTGGQVIKSFGRREDATAWLAGSVGPTTGVRPVLRARERRPHVRGKKAVG
jgi:hypothetical protein